MYNIKHQIPSPVLIHMKLMLMGERNKGTNQWDVKIHEATSIVITG